MVPKLTDKDVATNSRTCDVCGGGASWRWRGVRAPEYVRLNGGFGIARIVDDKDANGELFATLSRVLKEQANVDASFG